MNFRLKTTIHLKCSALINLQRPKSLHRSSQAKRIQQHREPRLKSKNRMLGSCIFSKNNEFKMDGKKFHHIRFQGQAAQLKCK